MKAKKLIKLLKENPESEVCIHAYREDLGYYVATAEWAVTQNNKSRSLLYINNIIDTNV